MRTALRAAMPAEGCGILGGLRAGRLLILQTFLPRPNILQARDRFAIDPIEFLRAVAALQCDGMDFLGFAHSHPGGTTAPSDTDVQCLWRHCLHLIAAPDASGACPIGAHWALGYGVSPLAMDQD